MVSVHLTSLVEDRQKFCQELDLVISRIYGNWRLVERFCYPPSDWTLEKPYGILMETPLSYAEAIVDAAKTSRVDLLLKIYRELRGKTPRVLVLDQWYVIADDFSIERME